MIVNNLSITLVHAHSALKIWILLIILFQFLVGPSPASLRASSASSGAEELADSEGRSEVRNLILYFYYFYGTQ